MGRRFWRTLFITIAVLSLVAFGVAYGQKKVGGGEIKYESKGANLGPVTFSHASHVEKHKAKCNDCHTKLFKMKKGDKLTQASFKEGKYCGACHNGQKAFSAWAEADCNKCHKK